MSDVVDQVEVERFIAKFANTTSEKKDKDRFWFAFADLIGLGSDNIDTETEARRSDKPGKCWADAFVPGRLLVEHKSAGESLAKAEIQAHDYLACTPALSANGVPRLVVMCDFQKWVVLDKATGSRTEFTLSELGDHIDRLAVLINDEDSGEKGLRDYGSVDRKAAEIMSKFLIQAEGQVEDGHNTAVLATRIMFLAFGDDLPLWKRHHVQELIEGLVGRPESVGPMLQDVFWALNTEKKNRSPRSKADRLRVFPYINGGLFAEDLPVVEFTQDMVDALIEVFRYDWTDVSPVIFGAIFQGAQTKAGRRSLGQHFTSESDIAKVLDNLFLDQLRKELGEIQDSEIELRAFIAKLGRITVADMACGSGNFLLVAFRELRNLEILAYARLREMGALLVELEDIADSGSTKDVLSKVWPDQIAGIEYDEFPSVLAHMTVFVMDMRMNRRMNAALGTFFERFPIKREPKIVHGNALRLDWETVFGGWIPKYVVGNPPFVGLGNQTSNADQTADRDYVLAPKHNNFGRVDYVACWYRKAVDLMINHPKTRSALVSTNSITQGVQVPALWGPLLREGVVIDFAHRTFLWSGEANVTCVIIGFGIGTKAKSKTLFDYSDYRDSQEFVGKECNSISPYLIDGPATIVDRAATPLADVPGMFLGHIQIDGGHLLLSEEEYKAVQSTDVIAAKYVKKFGSGKDVLTGKWRYCLWLVDADPADIARSPFLRQRVESCKAWRSEQKVSGAAYKKRDVPHLFGQIAAVEPTRFIGIAKTQSENRDYIPVEMLENAVVTEIYMIDSEDIALFGLVSSTMFRTWLATVGGRLENRFRLSSDLVYNTFPFPTLSDSERVGVEKAVQEIFDARAMRPGESLADMYPTKVNGYMHPELRTAHERLDKIVDRLFGLKDGATEMERFAVLMEKYVALKDSKAK